MISLRRLIRAYPPVLGLLVNVLPSGVGYIAFGLLMKRLFELMMTEPEVRGILLTCAGLAGIAIMRFLVALVMVPIEARARHAFGSVLRVGLVEAGIDGKGGPTSGGAHTMFRDDTEAIVDYVIDVIRVSTLVLFSISASVLVAIVNPLLLLAIGVPVLGGAFTASGLGRSLRARVRVGRKRTTQVLEFISGVMASLESIKIAGIEHRLVGRLESLSTARLTAERRENSAMEALSASGPVAMAVGAALMLCLSAILIDREAMVVSDLILALAYIPYIQTAGVRVARTLGLRQKALVSYQRLTSNVGDRLLRDRTAVAFEPPPTDLEAQSGGEAPQFANLSLVDLQWVGRNGVLNGPLSCMISAGQFVAVVGGPGSGKTGLLEAILGLIPLADGHLLWDGKRIAPRCLRPPRCAFKPQSPRLLNMSVAHNVALGHTTDLGRIADSLRTARLMNELQDWPEGLHTPVEPSGRGLSGGQITRVACARALIRECPLTILDEPTSGLDRQTARDLISAIRQNTSRAFIAATHDRDVIRAADYCIVRTDGAWVISGQ